MTRKSPRIVGPGPAGWTPEMYRCTHCEKPINPAKTAWLELDQRDDTYHDRGDVPDNLSQGWFPFGIACAKKVMKAEAA